MRIAYLAPELTALESTFVYQELLALERQGIRTEPFSVRRPARLLKQNDDLVRRTTYLYDGGVKSVAGRAFIALFRHGLSLRFKESLAWLVRDVFSIGLKDRRSWLLMYQYLAAVGLAVSLKQRKCDHLHIHFVHVPTQIGMYAASMTCIGYTCVAHANDIFERGLLLQQKACRAVKFFTISHFNLNYLLGLGVDKEKLAVTRCIFSTVDPGHFAASTTKPRYRVGSLGRLVEKKGFDVLLHAILLVKERGLVDVDLEIVGDGPDRDALEAIVRNLDLSGDVRFVGALDNSVVSSWMRSLDLFVLACKTDKNGDKDGIPVALMEAMSQHVAVVSTKLSGIPELVVHRETGLLVEPADPAALAVQIEEILLNPRARDHLRRAGWTHVQTEFGQQVNVDRLIAQFVVSLGMYRCHEK